jgi:hypothetical protein
MKNRDRRRGGEDAGAGDECEEKVLSPENEDTLWSMAILGLAYDI